LVEIEAVRFISHQIVLAACSQQSYFRLSAISLSYVMLGLCAILSRRLHELSDGYFLCNQDENTPITLQYYIA